MDPEQFIEENYFGLKIDCPRDIHTVYQALEDYANEQLRLHGVVGRSEQFICGAEIVHGEKRCYKQCKNCLKDFDTANKLPTTVKHNNSNGN